ncbi:hypothetical protein J3Q64DRAFT_1644284 [Phycomyces blakesleeanus]|uniref:YncI copper-binding domain-containing protein n=2 Tax=Phycomyces blakesleeanus TaxID=4837 RepID=A0A167KE78_PHYB8|nr:hypothetical protein PHYBLDRAFT_188887 [Phycomyces blakesleeanus NRRL 1555(-)]OAD67887.1 hypothetical protein PHYBLDRAFT_188887 [Phycomyces blakesleeanus NRRL 1555(-)]|eukprot:XP_018285927.1 hypothetical protein PHYBLDRAFT_188887 [Phycomyces blakesleeanus NRRL 1555(-)]
MSPQPSLVLAFVAAMAFVCNAHVGISPSTGQPGQSINGSFHVPHGCNGSATTGLSVSVPSEIVVLTPLPVSNWTLDVKYTKLDTPVQVNGVSVNQTVSSFSWTGGYVPADGLEEFGLTFTLPQVDLTNTPNVTIYFPIVQTCVVGSTEWTGIPGTASYNASTGSPAASFVIANSVDSTTADTHDHDHATSPTPSSSSGTSTSGASGFLTASLSGVTLFAAVSALFI